MGRLASPLILSWLAFFPLLAWEGGIGRLAGPAEGPPPWPRRLTGRVEGPAGQLAGATRNGSSTTSAGQQASPLGADGLPANAGGQRPAESLRRLPRPPDEASAQPAYAARLLQLQQLGATYVRLERCRRPGETYFVGHCELAGEPEASEATQLVARADSPELALDQLARQLRASDRTTAAVRP